MLANKETNDDAKEKYKSRKGRETLICPPIAELEEVAQSPTSKRKVPVCKKCGKPRKGHKKVSAAARGDILAFLLHAATQSPCCFHIILPTKIIDESRRLINTR